MRIVYLPVEEGNYPVSVVVSVPKRLFKRAVDRNLLKRRIREAYRLNKHVLYDQLLQTDQKLQLLLLYHQSEILDFCSIEAGLLKGFEKLSQELHKKQPSVNG